MTSEYLVSCAKRVERILLPPLLCDWTCVDSIFEIEDCPDGADNTVVSAESEALPQTVDALNPGAVRAENLHDLEFFQFVGGPIQLLVFGIVEMESADGSVYGCGANHFSGVFQRVDHAGVAATSEQNEAAGSVEHKGLVLGKVVF